MARFKSQTQSQKFELLKKRKNFLKNQKYYTICYVFNDSFHKIALKPYIEALYWKNWSADIEKSIYRNSLYWNINIQIIDP